MLFVKTYLRQVLVLFVLLLSLGAQAQVERFVEGVHYTILPELANAVALDENAGTVDVMEIFWYGCGHCYAFDPLLNDWAEKQDTSVSFSRSPLMVWSPADKQHARLFFATQQLGKAGELHSIIFDEVQKHRNPLADEASAAELFTSRGVAAADFKKAYDSFAVDSQMRKTETMQKELRISGVPLLIVNGKYRVEGNAAVPTHQAMLEVVDFLVRKEKSGS